MAKDEKQQLTLRMNNLAAELAGVERGDPRWAEIVTELSQLSLRTTSVNGRATDG